MASATYSRDREIRELTSDDRHALHTMGDGGQSLRERKAFATLSSRV